MVPHDYVYRQHWAKCQFMMAVRRGNTCYTPGIKRIVLRIIN